MIAGSEGIRNALRSFRLALGFLLGRRLGLFLTIDALIVLRATWAMLLSVSGDSIAFYYFLFLMPSLALGLPALAGMVDLERRAGCLDLALSMPAAEAYFVRRAAAVAGAMALQGWFFVVVGWLYLERVFPLLLPLVSVALASAFLAAVSLFWAVRLARSGLVWVASLVTSFAAGHWLFFDPTDRPAGGYTAPFLPNLDGLLAWLESAAVLGVGTLLFYLYARARLRRPERMLS